LSALHFFPFKLLPATLHPDIGGSFVLKYLMLSTLEKFDTALHSIIAAIYGKTFLTDPSAQCSCPPDHTKDKTRQYPNRSSFDKNKISRFKR